LAKIKHFLIDVEGTVVEGKSLRPISGVGSWLERVRESGGELKLLTNNTTHSPAELFRLLRRRGVEIHPGELITCLEAARKRLERGGTIRCFVIGSPAMKRFFRGEGFEIGSEGKFEAVVVGLDEKLTLQKLKTAARSIRQDGATLVAMHKGRLYVNRKGEVSLSSGAIVSALEYACGVRAMVVGKPSRRFFRVCMSGWGVDPGEVMMISDDPLSDLAGAKRMGMRTAFVLSGAYRGKEVLARVNRKLLPDLVVNRISEIPV
jgi:HAD superfamily hydrolase (TIGR01458 family)